MLNKESDLSMRHVAGKWKWAGCLMLLTLLFVFGGSREVSADAAKCKVTFANAKGVVSTSTYRNWCKTVEAGDWIKLPKFSQDGYQCYWVLKNGNTARRYYTGANYRVTKDTKFCLYRYKEYTVRFMTANGKKEYTARRQTAIQGQNILLPEFSNTTTNQLVGWKTSMNASAYYKVGTRVKVTGNMKFYPVYKKVTGVYLRYSNGTLWKLYATNTDETPVFPSVNLTNGDMCLGWSRTRGKTTQPEYYAGDKIPTKSGNYYMVVFPKSKDNAPSYLNTPTKYDRVYFVGDSRTAGMQEALGSQAPDNVKFICKGSQGLAWFRQTTGDGGYRQLLLDLKKQPKNMKKAVVINLGVNDMQNISVYLTYMRSLANNLSRNYNCTMYYLSVNPINSAMILNAGGGIRTEAQVASFNRNIYRYLCTGLNKCYTYINTCSSLQKYGWISDRHDAGIHDGLHYSNETYLRIYDYCIRTLNR